MTTGSAQGPASGLLIRHGGGAWMAPAVTGFANENEMQTLLFEHPELIPGVGGTAVACREFQSGVGPADVLVIHGDGSLVVAECKLAQNPQVRREIIGQVLDYSARMWRMPIGEFEERWAQRTGSGPFEAFGEASGQVRDSVASALEAGRFTLLLAVDGINPDLRRIVEYLNAVTQPDTSVLAFEVARVADGDVEVLMPRVYGAELARAKAAPAAQPSWSRAQYLSWLGDNQPEVRDAMEALITEAEADGWVLSNGTAASTPSVILGKDLGGRTLWPISLFTRPEGSTVQVRIYQVADVVPNPEEFVEALGRIPGGAVDVATVRAAGFRKRVDLPSSLFVDPAVRETFAQALRLVAVPEPASGILTDEGTLP